MKTIKNPFVVIFPPFAIGVLFAHFFNLYISFGVILSLLLLLIFFELAVFRRHFEYALSLITIFLFILGIYVYDFHKTKPSHFDSRKNYTLTGVVCDPLSEKSKTFKTFIKLKAYKDSAEWKSLNDKIVIYIDKQNAKKIKYGDLIVFNTQLSKIKNNGNPFEFDYEKFMNNKGIYYSAYVKSEKLYVLTNNKGFFLKKWALSVRQDLMNIYKKSQITGRAFSVLSALTLGYKEELDKETRQIFANTGAMHILAVSGLHVGIIYLVLLNLLSFMDKKRHLFVIKSFLIILSLWFFAAIAGFSASVIRSATMFSLFIIGRLIKKNTSFYNIIFASAFLMLLFNPSQIFEVGFQLSYFAVLAIVFFQPYIYEIFIPPNVIIDKIWALTSVSIAAQLGTMPIGLFYFHQFPTYFFLTNIFVIPLASLILYTAILLFIVSFSNFLLKIVAFLLKFWLKLLLGIVEIINKLPYSSIHNIYITSSQTLFLYAFIISIVLFFILKNKKLIYVSLSSLIILLSIDIVYNFNSKKSEKIVVFNVPGKSVVYIDAGDIYLFSDTTFYSDTTSFNFIIKPLLVGERKTNSKLLKFKIEDLKQENIYNNVFASKTMFFQLKKHSFLLLNSNQIFKQKNSEKIKVDFIILSRNVYLSVTELLKYFDFKKIIFDSSNKWYRIVKWTQECENNDIEYYDVGSFGAWVCRLN